METEQKMCEAPCWGVRDWASALLLSTSMQFHYCVNKMVDASFYVSMILQNDGIFDT